MPRPRRLHVPGGLYHAVLRGNHRKAIFGHGDDYLHFEEIVARALERYGAELLAYCWMTNHVHLAVRIGEAPLGAVMGIIASRYARARQQALETTGHLFERRYRARLVDANRYLLALVRYIHLNPVRACMVADPRDYRWSSHRAYLGAPCPGWLRIEPVLAVFGSSPDAARAAYRRFMNEVPDDADRDAITPNARRGAGHHPEIGSPARAREPGSHTVPRALDAIIAAVAAERGVAVDALLSKRRHPALVKARKEIARLALAEGAANLSQVARQLNRAPTTLSGLLRNGR
ncbi:MAG: REP-associated tyrosine transposase [Pseudomonadota bacterium]|nr:REP-associated tyrosine transposase [Pseudomonadota bacterium]